MVKGAGVKVSPPRKWLCAVGWIRSSSFESSFWNGRLTIDYVMHDSPEFAATRMHGTLCEKTIYIAASAPHQLVH